MRPCARPAESSSPSSCSPPGRCCRTSWPSLWCPTGTLRHSHLNTHSGTYNREKSLRLPTNSFCELLKRLVYFSCRRFHREILPSPVSMASPSAEETWLRFACFLTSTSRQVLFYFYRSRMTLDELMCSSGLYHPFNTTLSTSDHQLHGVGCKCSQCCTACEYLQTGVLWYLHCLGHTTHYTLPGRVDSGASDDQTRPLFKIYMYNYHWFFFLNSKWQNCKKKKCLKCS